MSVSRIALLATASLAFACSLAQSAQPPLLTRWRPAAVPTAQVSLPAYVAPRFVPAEPAFGQIAYVDPATGGLLPGPPPGEAGRPDFVRLPEPAAQMRAGRTPEGFLFIETNGHHATLTATLDAQGGMQLHCGDPSHRHDAGADHLPSTGSD